MKPILALLLCLLSGCATYASKERVAVYSNADYVEWHGGENPSLVMRGVNNSTPTRAGGSVVGTAGSSLASIIMAWFTGGAVK